MDNSASIQQAPADVGHGSDVPIYDFSRLEASMNKVKNYKSVIEEDKQKRTFKGLAKGIPNNESHR